MKQSYTLILFLVTFHISAQTIITLNVNQPPELGFEIGATSIAINEGDTTVLGQDLTVSGGSGEYEFSWTPSESLSDTTALQPKAFPVDTTTYFLTVSDVQGCSFTVSYTVNVKTFTSITDNLLTQQFLSATLFPNPTDGMFKIQLKGESQGKIELTIIDISGKILNKQIIENFTGDHTEILNLRLPAGVYNLLIIAKDQKISREFIIN